ncbi:MAG: hypothetical protein C5B49_08545 [Bdellovibrio sp.]|nr:MAG: hypothetical protein C5B49_08545 [Bdellovibrio sp.]
MIGIFALSLAAAPNADARPRKHRTTHSKHMKKKKKKNKKSKKGKKNRKRRRRHGEKESAPEAELV